MGTARPLQISSLLLNIARFCDHVVRRLGADVLPQAPGNTLIVFFGVQHFLYFPCVGQDQVNPLAPYPSMALIGYVTGKAPDPVETAIEQLDHVQVELLTWLGFSYLNRQPDLNGCLLKGLRLLGL